AELRAARHRAREPHLPDGRCRRPLHRESDRLRARPGHRGQPRRVGGGSRPAPQDDPPRRHRQRLWPDGGVRHRRAASSALWPRHDRLRDGGSGRHADAGQGDRCRDAGCPVHRQRPPERDRALPRRLYRRNPRRGGARLPSGRRDQAGGLAGRGGGAGAFWVASHRFRGRSYHSCRDHRFAADPCRP
ncbi:hypothetical protein OY671_009276, partial [Metschnikowia pulcherrima]